MRELTGQRQFLLTRLVQSQEAERVRIAHQVHDDSVQAVAAAELRLDTLRRHLHRDAAHLLPDLDRTSEALSAALGRLRHLLFDLDSPTDRSSLSAALEDAAAVIFEAGPQWRVDEDQIGDGDLPSATGVIAYRIAKEAMTNARKHAAATSVTVTIRHAPGVIEVEVADNGRGFDADAERGRVGHLGLAGMHDRAELAGGQLIIDSAPGRGARVVARLPYRAAVP